MEGIWQWAARRLPGILILLSAMMCALNAWFYFEWNHSRNNAINCENERKYFFKYDDLVIRSAKSWSKFSHEPLSEITSTYYPNVVYLKNDTCVALSPMNSLGGIPVYCYDRKSKQPTFVNQDVE